MSEAQPENPNQAVQPGAGETTGQPQAPQPQPAAAQQQPQQQSSDSAQTFSVSLVKRPTGDVHWNVARGVWETITHAETGEPTQEYALVTTIDGVEVTLETYNAGRLETIVRSQQQAQQQSEA